MLQHGYISSPSTYTWLCIPVDGSVPTVVGSDVVAVTVVDAVVVSDINPNALLTVW